MTKITGTAPKEAKYEELLSMIHCCEFHQLSLGSQSVEPSYVSDYYMKRHTDIMVSEVVLKARRFDNMFVVCVCQDQEQITELFSSRNKYWAHDK